MKSKKNRTKNKLALLRSRHRSVKKNARVIRTIRTEFKLFDVLFENSLTPKIIYFLFKNEHRRFDMRFHVKTNGLHFSGYFGLETHSKCKQCRRFLFPLVLTITKYLLIFEEREKEIKKFFHSNTINMRFLQTVFKSIKIES